jgi:hypothetical protein
MNSNIIDLMTKNKPDQVHLLEENLKSSPIVKFAVNPEIVLQTLTV